MFVPGQDRVSGIIGDSFVVGEKGVESTDRGSRLLGGTLQSSGSVLLDNVGEPSGPEALIEVTISPFYKALLMQLTKDMVRAKHPKIRMRSIRSGNRLRCVRQNWTGNSTIF
jgi:hypothetical protein